MSNNKVEILNSLGKRSVSGYLGYRERSTFKEFAKYISGISQKSFDFIYKK